MIPADTTPVVAVVPLRDGVSGKSRLAAALDDGTRQRLVTVLAEHVLRTLTESAGVERVLVVTADPPFAERVAAAASSRRIDVLAQDARRPGLNGALDTARDEVRRRRPETRLLVVHADLPALTRADVAALVAPEADVVLAGDGAAVGTNALVVAASAPFMFRFGPGSLAAHRGEAAARGLGVTVVDRPGTRVDLDTTADWARLPLRVRREVGRRVEGA